MMAERRYPDSAVGALAYLRDVSSLDVDGARAFPDPSVEGVWGVDLKDGSRAVVYLAGYRDPFGRVREQNDFEVGEEVGS